RPPVRQTCSRASSQTSCRRFSESSFTSKTSAVLAEILAWGRLRRHRPTDTRSSSNLFVVNPSLYDPVPSDPYKDFDPVVLAAEVTSVITVHPSLPVKTVKDLVGFIKANPGKHNYTSGGIGTTPHLMAEQLRLSQGLDLVQVPFNSGGLAIGSAVAGHTPISFGGLTRMPTVAAVGTNSCSSSSRFDPTSMLSEVTPVRLPLGRLRLVTN